MEYFEKAIACEFLRKKCKLHNYCINAGETVIESCCDANIMNILVDGGINNPRMENQEDAFGSMTTSLMIWMVRCQNFGQ
jgi:hypothetical protein